MSILRTDYDLATQDKVLCKYCGSENVSFIEFDNIAKRLNYTKILAEEIWSCHNCGREFKRMGTLFSPEDVTRIKLRVALLTWAGYATGSLIGYAIYSTIV